MSKAGTFAPHRHSISQVFVFVLLGVFAVMSTFMVLLSAQMYRGIVDQTEQNSAYRIMTSYVMNAVRGSDKADSIYIDERNGIDVLVFGWNVDGDIYETLIYCHDGMLRELFTSADQDFEPDYGEKICSAQSFEAVINDGLLEVKMTDGMGDEVRVDVALRSGGRK